MTTLPDFAPQPVGPPDGWSSHVALSDGGTVLVRPISAADGPALVAFHGRLSPDTVYRRFFSVHPVLRDDEVERFTHVDYGRRMAFVGELDGQLIGVGRYERLGDQPLAEVAFVVDDRHQGRGLGTVLLEALAAFARAHGIDRFEADTLATNREMLAVFRRAGLPVVTKSQFDLAHVDIAIAATPDSEAAVGEREHRAEARSMSRLLSPASVAVIGAGRAQRSVGHQVLVNLAAAGFPGPIYPVNPRAAEVAGLVAYPTVAAVPGPIDLAVVAVPASQVPQVVDECADKGVAGLVVLTAGFAETGPTGRAAQELLLGQARDHGLRLVGPNCVGLINTAARLDVTFCEHHPPAGGVAMQSQSGAAGIALLELAARSGLGISSFVSTGNQLDVSSNDLLQYWADDPATDVVLLYLESFGNPRKFGRIARRVARQKPVVAVKSGRSAAGARAAGSHTAAMASSDVAVDALFDQAGVIRVDRLDELFEMGAFLAHQPLPGGRRVAIVGNSGGPGVMAADAAEGNGLVLAELSASTRAALRLLAGAGASIANPVDVLASATPPTFESAVRVVLADPGVDAVVVVATGTVFAGPADVAAAVQRAGAGTGKPVLGAFLAWAARPPLVAGAPGAPLPTFSEPEAAMRCAARAARYREWLRRDPGHVPALPGTSRSRARGLVEAAMHRLGPDGGWLDPVEASSLLTAYGLNVLPQQLVSDADGAALAADRLGYPVAVKAVGPLHKTEVGGVTLGAVSASAVREAVASMQARLGPSVTGAVVQPMAESGVEMIIGVVADPLFGPLVMLGAGGTAAELLDDRRFRLTPLTDVDAHDLVRSLRTSPLLFGHRGAPPAAVGHLEASLLLVSQMVEENPEILELDLNPVVVSTSCSTVVDARVRVGPSPSRALPGTRPL